MSSLIANNAEGFDRLYVAIRAATPDLCKVKVGLEATGHYSYNILGFLLDKGLATYVINPLHTNLFRKSTSLRRTKTDRVDARTIVAMMMSGVVLESYTAISYHNEELKSLTRYRFEKVRERAKLKQSLSRLVTILFPELEKLVPTLHVASAYALLAELPGAKQVASCHLTHLTTLLEKTSKGRYRKEKAIELREAARHSIGTCMPAKSLELQHTIRLIRELTAEIDEIEAMVKEMLDEIKSPILTIPGISYRMGVGSMVFPMLVSFVLKENVAAWFLAMLAVALFTALTVYLQYKFTRERVTEELLASHSNQEKASTASLAQQLKAVTSEKLWWIIVVFYLVFQWSGAVKNGSMSYFCKWVLDNTFFGSADAWGASQSLLAILGAVPMAIAAAFVVPLANRFGKRIVTLVGLAVGVLGGIIAGLGNGSIMPTAIGVAIKCLGSAPACYLILAMLADVIDHIEYKHHIRTDGLTMSIYSSLMVAATPVCNAIFSAILSGSGYDQVADVAMGVMAQTEITKGAITVSYIWVETIGFAIGALLILLFTVENNLKQEQEEIDRETMTDEDL